MVITLCGSTKFKEEFIEINKQLTMAGHVVISVGLFGHADGLLGNEITDEVKEMLDRVHKQKIDISEAIVVLNVNGYIGASTYNEIKHAHSTGKKIYILDLPKLLYTLERGINPIIGRNRANVTMWNSVIPYKELLQIGGTND